MTSDQETTDRNECHQQSRLIERFSLVIGAFTVVITLVVLWAVHQLDQLLTAK